MLSFGIIWSCLNFQFVLFALQLTSRSQVICLFTLFYRGVEIQFINYIVVLTFSNKATMYVFRRTMFFTSVFPDLNLLTKLILFSASSNDIGIINKGQVGLW